MRREIETRECSSFLGVVGKGEEMVPWNSKQISFCVWLPGSHVSGTSTNLLGIEWGCCPLNATEVGTGV